MALPGGAVSEALEAAAAMIGNWEDVALAVVPETFAEKVSV